VKFRTRLAIAALCSAAAIAALAAAPDLDGIIRLWAAATGGMARIRSVRAVRMTGRITFGDDPARPLVVELARPGSIRTEIAFPEGTYVQAFDGTRGWTLSHFGGAGGPVPMTSEEAAAAPEQADMDGPLVDFEKKGIRLALEGTEPVEGRPAYRIRVTRPDGTVRHLDLDVQSSLKVRWTGELGPTGKKTETSSIFSDYRVVNGLTFPFRIRSGPSGKPANQEIVFEKIEVDPAIDPTRFRMPPESPPAAP